jgi:hypothetical protein
LRGQLTSSQDVATGGLFTLNHHDIQHLHRAAAAKKEAAAQLKEAKKLEAAAKKRKQQEDKLERQTQKKQKDVDRSEKKRLDTYWKEVASNGWRDQLQVVMKSNVQPPPSAYKGKYCGSMLAVCIYNQRRRRFIMLRKRAAEAGHVLASSGVA